MGARIGNLIAKVSAWITQLSLGKLWNFNLSVEETKSLIERLDTNKDGKISLYEIVIGVIGYTKVKAKPKS